jgi:lipopolysaccharide export system protein LptC
MTDGVAGGGAPLPETGAAVRYRPRRARWNLRKWLANLPDNPHSRRVALLRVALPTIGISLLLLVGIWPRIAPLFDRLRFAAIDLREARELRMINPHYVGTDRENHPFVFTAAVGRQVPGRDDVMSLEGVEVDLKTHSGANIIFTSDSGVYQSRTQLFDAFGHVTMIQQNGTRFVTASARLDAVNNAAEGHEPIEGHGPSGKITAQGFRLIDKGEIVIFTGQSDATLNSAQSRAAKTEPAALPPSVAQAAAQIEARALSDAANASPDSGAPAAAPAAQSPAAPAPAEPKPPAKNPG